MGLIDSLLVYKCFECGEKGRAQMQADTEHTNRLTDELSVLHQCNWQTARLEDM